MEQDLPTFLTKEQREDIRFYQDWIETVWMKNDYYPDDLHVIQQKLEGILNQYDGSLPTAAEEQLSAALETCKAEQARRTTEVADEFNQHIFSTGMFRVGIVTPDGVYEVEAATTERNLVLPVVDNKPYQGEISEVLFDK
ncbi:TPA: hypothetical protein DCF80_00145 [Candidatus Saccharibacteria bacterium]|nr:hypothetical protein [Candidatus Saccharibacteria bacterium]HRK41334.1 hypothetical protein [Candidatus Saccharibacteria bacterium]